MAISDDLIWDILLKLPIKSLFRFKNVSKVWKAMISNSKFTRSHFLNMSQDDHNNNFLVYKKCKFQTFSTLKTDENQIDGRHGYSDLETNQDIEFPEVVSNSVSIPWWQSSYTILTVMHCDGLLCLFPSYEPLRNPRVVVWNPLITQQHKKFLRPPHNRFYQHQWEAFGFGYDSAIDGYKIVYVRGHHELGPAGTKVRTLRLKHGSWEPPMCVDIPYLFDIRVMCSAVHLKGCLYWIAKPILNNGHQICSNRRALLCFDLKKNRMIEETSLSMPLNYTSRLSFFRGSLCMAMNCEKFTSIDVFIMKEDEVTETKTWMKFMTIPDAFEITIHHSRAALLYITKNGQVLTYKGFSMIPYSQSLIAP